MFSLIGIEHMRITDHLSHLRALQHFFLVPSHHWPGMQGIGMGGDESIGTRPLSRVSCKSPQGSKRGGGDQR